MKKNIWLIMGLLVIASLLFVACGGGTPAEEAEEAVEETAAEVEEAAEEVEEAAEEAADEVEEAVEEAADEVEEAAPSGDKVQVRWYVGLGAGSDEPLFEPQEQVVADFNASQDDIELVLEIVDADLAYQTLATQIAAGNAPDLVGPVGIRGRDFFRGAWLDLTELIEANNYDLSDFDESMVKFYTDNKEGQLGLPFAIFPSFLSYNKDLFDEAGLNYPPAEYGEPYIDADGNEVEWNLETLEEIAKILTVDANGNDATSPDFDPDNIVQFGFSQQWTDYRGAATLFGPGSLVDDENNAQIPDNWREAAKWYHKVMWEDHIYPTDAYVQSDILGNDNAFESGNLAMAQTHLWYTGCCMGNTTFEWDTGAMPAVNDQTTAKMHADTFAITKGTENPEAAFEVLSFFIGENADEMTKMYGGMPARLSLQGDYFDTFAQGVPGGESVNWDPVVAAMAYADNPNHESYMPSPQEANERYNEFWTLVTTDPDLDVDAELDQLIVDLQAIYDAAGNE